MPKPLAFHEPWTAQRRASAIADPFPEGPTDHTDPAAVAFQREAAQRALQRETWVIWGTGMLGSGPARSLMGQNVTFNDKGVMLVVPRPVTTNDTISAKTLAERVVSCVNACVNIQNPVDTLNQVRELLAGLASCEIDPTDERIEQLLHKLGRL